MQLPATTPETMAQQDAEAQAIFKQIATLLHNKPTSSALQALVQVTRSVTRNTYGQWAVDVWDRAVDEIVTTQLGKLKEPVS